MLLSNFIKWHWQFFLNWFCSLEREGKYKLNQIRKYQYKYIYSTCSESPLDKMSLFKEYTPEEWNSTSAASCPNIPVLFLFHLQSTFCCPGHLSIYQIAWKERRNVQISLIPCSYELQPTLKQVHSYIFRCSLSQSRRAIVNSCWSFCVTSWNIYSNYNITDDNFDPKITIYTTDYDTHWLWYFLRSAFVKLINADQINILITRPVQQTRKQSWW